MKVLAVANHKGGVGKTTVCEIFSEYLPLIRGIKTGFADLDMQCNYTDGKIGLEKINEDEFLTPKHPGYDPTDDDVCERSSIADCFYGKNVLPFPTWITEEIGKNGAYLDVFAGHPYKLDEVNVAFGRAKDYIATQALNALRLILHGEDFEQFYSLIGLDLGPSRNPIFRSALRAATHVVIPFVPEKKALQGINTMLQVIRQENYSRPNDIQPLKLIGLLPNLVQIRTRTHRKSLAAIKEYHQDLLFPEECWLGRSIAVPERDEPGANPSSVFKMSDSSPLKQQAIRMCDYLYEKIFNED